MPSTGAPANTLSPLFDRAGAILPPEPLDALAAAVGTPEQAVAAFGLGLPLFAFAIAVSPGPSNVLLLSAGSRAGARGGLALLVGLALGYAAMWGLAGSGLRAAVALDPTLMRLVQGVALTLMMVMAWRLLTSRADGEMEAANDSGAPARPARVGGVMAGFAFQWLNPKAWVSALAAAALFCSPDMGTISHAAWFGVTAMVAVMLGCGAWLVAGAMGGGILSRPGLRTALNGALAVTLLGSAIPLLAV